MKITRKTLFNGRGLGAWCRVWLGCSQEEIGKKLGVSWRTINDDCKNFHLGKIAVDLGSNWNGQEPVEYDVFKYFKIYLKGVDQK